MNVSLRSSASAQVSPFDMARVRALAISRRALKISFAVALCSAGAYGMLSESNYIATSNAVVSADVVEVRTPIDGTITGLPLAAGTFVEADQLLGSVDNPRSERQHLDDLRTLENSALSTVDALTTERNLLQAQRSALLARARIHSSAVSARLNEQAIQITRTLSERELALVQAKTELRRAEQLHSAGILADAEFDRIRSAQQIAVEAVAAMQADLESSRAQAADAERGVLSEPGAVNDVSYSQQRADELAIKLAENASSLSIALGQSREAHLSVEAEAVRVRLMRQSEVRSPMRGLLWKLNSTNGERMANGASVVSLVDCDRQFLLAQVPQTRVPDIAIQGEARIRLAGESEERTGTVISVSGDALKVRDAKLAALPLEQSAEQMATVLVALKGKSLSSGTLDQGQPTSTSPCIVGRTARVLIPTFSTNLATRWTHQLL